MCFPDLFPTHQGSMFAFQRKEEIPLNKFIAHYTRYADVLPDGIYLFLASSFQIYIYTYLGTIHYRFASHEMWPYWVMNIKDRHNISNQISVI